MLIIFKADISICLSRIRVISNHGHSGWQPHRLQLGQWHDATTIKGKFFSSPDNIRLIYQIQQWNLAYLGLGCGIKRLLLLLFSHITSTMNHRLEVNAFEFHFIHYIFFSHTHCLNVSELEMLFAILVKFWAQSHSCLKELWPKLFLYCTSAQVRIPHQSMEAMLAIGMLRFRRQCRSCLYAPIIGNVAVAGCLYAPTASSRPQKTHVGLFTAIVGIVGLWRDIVLG